MPDTVDGCLAGFSTERRNEKSPSNDHPTRRPANSAPGTSASLVTAGHPVAVNTNKHQRSSAHSHGRLALTTSGQGRARGHASTLGSTAQPIDSFYQQESGLNNSEHGATLKGVFDDDLVHSANPGMVATDRGNSHRGGDRNRGARGKDLETNTGQLQEQASVLDLTIPPKPTHSVSMRHDRQLTNSDTLKEVDAIDSGSLSPELVPTKPTRLPGAKGLPPPFVAREAQPVPKATCSELLGLVQCFQQAQSWS